MAETTKRRPETDQDEKQKRETPGAKKKDTKDEKSGKSGKQGKKSREGRDDEWERDTH